MGQEELEATHSETQEPTMGRRKDPGAGSGAQGAAPHSVHLQQIMNTLQTGFSANDLESASPGFKSGSDTN